MPIDTLTIQRVQGREIWPFIPMLAALRVSVFRDYPYLYDGSMEYEADYLNHYADTPQSMMVLALDESKPEREKVVGASTGMPLTDYGEAVSEPFAKVGYALETFFYFGESVLDHAYRNRGIGVRFFEERERFAREHGYSIACFCAVERPEDHPLKPEAYRPLDAFWQKRGYQKHPDLLARFSWKDIDEPEETAKPLTFWLKRLQ